MDPRVSFITLAVCDVEASRAFYVDGLGWEAELFVPGEVVMIMVGPHQVLSLWDRAAFEDETGAPAASGGAPPVTLAHNVPTPADVDRVLEEARAAGAPAVSAGKNRDWGGYTGYFADPDGFRWEIAHNPGEIGQRVLPPVERPERPPRVIDLDEAQSGLRFLPDRTPTSPAEAFDGVFATLSPYRDGGVFTGEWSGTSEWERHPAGDEIVMVLDGATTLFTLDDDGEHAHDLGPGQLIVVPENVWHRFETPDHVRVLAVTPQPTDHQVEHP